MFGNRFSRRYRPRHGRAFGETVLSLSLLTFLVVLGSEWGGPARPVETLLRDRPVAVSRPFRNCAAARAAGAAPVYRGDPGYGEHLDADSDGIGCEPPRR